MIDTRKIEVVLAFECEVPATEDKVDIGGKLAAQGRDLLGYYDHPSGELVKVERVFLSRVSER